VEQFSITLHAVRPTNFTVASDGQPAADVTLEAGGSRVFHATRAIEVLPVDASALEWSANGVPARGMTGALTITPDAIQSLAGRQ
jgi:hypothetical protein